MEDGVFGRKDSRREVSLNLEREPFGSVTVGTEGKYPDQLLKRCYPTAPRSQQQDGAS